MALIAQPLDAYLAQLSSIQTHDTTDRVGSIAAPTLVIAGEEDILIPVGCHGGCTLPSPGPSGRPAGWSRLVWEHPTPFNQAVIEFVAITTVSR